MRITVTKTVTLAGLTAPEFGALRDALEYEDALLALAKAGYLVQAFGAMPRDSRDEAVEAYFVLKLRERFNEDAFCSALAEVVRSCITERRAAGLREAPAWNSVWSKLSGRDEAGAAEAAQALKDKVLNDYVKKLNLCQEKLNAEELRHREAVAALRAEAAGLKSEADTILKNIDADLSNRARRTM